MLKNNKKFKTFVIIAVLVVLAFLLLRGCGSGQGEAGEGGGQPPIPSIVKPAQAAALNTTIGAFGVLQAAEETQLVAQVSGILTAQKVADGAAVTQGTVLFEIDPRRYKAAYNAALAAHEVAKAEYQRSLALQKDKLISSQQLQALKGAADSAKATLDAAQADYADTQVRAPFTGTLGISGISVGNFVRAGEHVLANLRTSDDLEVAFHVNAREYAQVVSAMQGAQPLSILIFEDALAAKGGESAAKARATLTATEGAIGRTSGKVELLGSVVMGSASQQLFPGRSVYVQLVLENIPGAILVPAEAVRTAQGPEMNGPFVYVVTAEGTAQPRPVELGGVYPGEGGTRMQHLKSGVSEGERVVVRHNVLMRPGATVIDVLALQQQGAAQ